MAAGYWALHTSSHLIPTVTPKERRGFYPGYADGETEAQKWRNLPKVGKDVTSLTVRPHCLVKQFVSKFF